MIEGTFTLENFGRIKSASMKMKPLTVFIGPNNTNKTWALWAYYFAMRGLAAPDFFSRRIGTVSVGAESDLRALARELSDRLNFASSTRALKSVKFGVAERLPPMMTLSLSLSGAELAKAEGFAPDVIRGASVRWTGNARVRSHAIEVYADAHGSPGDSNAFRLVGLKWGDFTSQDQTGDAPDHQANTIHDMMCDGLREHYDVLVPLPVTRHATTKLVLDATSPRRTSFANSIESDFVRGALRGSRYKRSGNQPHSAMLSELLGGDLEFGDENTLPTIQFRSGNTSVAIDFAASFVRSVAPIVSALAIPSTNSFLAIDEPEMHAHPEAQLGIIELLAAAVNNGTHIVITTHSPYIVDHLDTLMAAAEIPTAAARARFAKKLALKSKEAIISRDKVAVYDFAEKRARSNGKSRASGDAWVEIREAKKRGSKHIDWDTFGRVSERTGQLYNDVLNALAKEG